MLIYDFICSQGHQFEGWFANLEDMEAQLAARALSCPVCGNENISRKPSTFGLMRSSRPGSPAEESAPPADPQTQFQEFIRGWEEASGRLTRDFEDVGSSFTEEALKMHYGVAAPRNIRGQSTDSQEEMLRKEGVEFVKVPLLSRKPPSVTEN